MTTRNDVERLAQEADNRLYTSDIAVPYKLVRDLCRAWLALDAAPEVELVSAEDDGWWVNGARDADEEMEIDRMAGEKVRLVATPASGGPRDG